nr:hypothetical protein [Tanacetum cinerariifolium]
PSENSLKVLHKLTTNVVTGVVIHYTVSSVSDVLVSLVGKIPICYDDDDDEESSTPLRDIIISELPSCIAITPVLSTKETKDSLIIGDEHLDTTLEKESDKFIKSSVKNLVPNLSERKDLSNIGRIDEADCDPEEEIRLIEKFLYDNSSPRPLKEINSVNCDAIIDSFSPSPILVEDSDPFMEDINLFLTFNGSIPSGIDSDYSDFEGENLFLERLLHDYPIPLPDILDFSNVIQFFPPLFTYPVTTSILLSFGSEDTLFDPGISDYHLSSLEPNVSH